MKKEYIIALMLTHIGSVNAFIYQVQVVRKWDKVHNAYQYVIGCGDWHDKTDASTHSQREQLEYILQRCNPDTTKVLVEDLSSNNQGKPARCGPFVVNTKGGVLGGLAQVCCRYNLPMENIEYRHCRVAALGPLLRTPTINLNTHNATRSITVSNVLNETLRQIDEMKRYAHPQLVQVIHDMEKKVMREGQRLHLDRHLLSGMSDYIGQHSKVDTRFDLLKSVLIFDSVLLDFKIADAVVKAKDKRTVIVIAGGTHITQSSKLLQDLGYERVYVSPMLFAPEYDLSKCLGANIVEGKYCNKPQPVSLGLIEHYAKLK